MSTDSRIGSLSSILSSSPSRRATVTSLKQADTGLSETSEIGENSSKPAEEPSTARLAEVPTKPVPYAKPARPAATKEVHRRVVCRVLQESHDQLAAYARSHNISHGAVVLQAVEKAHTDGAFAADRAYPATGSSLFVGTSAARIRPAAARVILDVRLHSQDVDVLDRLVTEHGVKDRTDLITQALTYFLADGDET